MGMMDDSGSKQRRERIIMVHEVGKYWFNILKKAVLVVIAVGDAERVCWRWHKNPVETTPKETKSEDGKMLCRLKFEAAGFDISIKGSGFLGRNSNASG